MTTIDAKAITALLDRANLGSPDSIYKAAEHFFERRMNILLRLQDANLRRIRADLTKMGAEILHWRHSRSGEVYSVHDYIAANMPSPLVITNDGEEFHLTSHGMAASDCALLHRLDTRVRDMTRDALRAGRGLDFGFGLRLLNQAKYNVFNLFGMGSVNMISKMEIGAAGVAFG